MNETKKVQVNRCFDDKCPQNTDPKGEQKVKDVLLTAVQRRRANKEIDCLLKQFRGRRIIDLLPVIKFRFPDILVVALERVEGKQYELGSKDAIFLAKFKADLEKSE